MNVEDIVDSTLPLQEAIIGLLRADQKVAAIVGKRSWDAPPARPQKPYVTLGPVQIIPVSADCYQGADVFLQVDGWADGPHSVPIKQLGRVLLLALNGAELPIAKWGQRLVDFRCDGLQYLREPDGITQHVAITMHAQTEPIGLVADMQNPDNFPLLMTGLNV